MYYQVLDLTSGLLKLLLALSVSGQLLLSWLGLKNTREYEAQVVRIARPGVIRE